MVRIGKDTIGALTEWNNSVQGTLFSVATSFVIKTMAVRLISEAGHHVKFAILDASGKLLWADNVGQQVIVSPTGEWNWYKEVIDLAATSGQQVILAWKTDGCTQFYDEVYDRGRWLGVDYNAPWTDLAFEHGEAVNSVFASDETPPTPPVQKIVTHMYHEPATATIPPGETLTTFGQLQYVDPDTGSIMPFLDAPMILYIDGQRRVGTESVSNSYDGGFQLNWIPTASDIGVHAVVPAYEGDDTHEPCQGSTLTITVSEVALPPAPPVKQLPVSTDPRFNHNPICLSDADITITDVPDIDNEGFAFVRIDFAWTDLEPTRGVYDFEGWKNTDSRVTALFQKGINVLGILCYGHPQYTGAWNKPAQTATELQAWVNFVKAMVNHFKDRVKCWEVYNEPNAGGFWDTGAPESSPQSALEYMTLLKATYPAVKEVDPTAIVVAPSMWGLWTELDSWMETLYKNGLKDYSDVISCHPYCGAFLPTHQWTGWFSPFDFPHMKDLVGLMVKYGDGLKEIWITEMGVALNDVSDGQVADEQRQSDIIMYGWYMSQWADQGYSNVTKYFVHSWLVDDPNGGFGIKGRLAQQTVLDMASIYNTAGALPPEELTVTVINSTTSEAIPSASVTLNGYSGVTDSNGVVVISLPVGSYTLTVSKLGFVTSTTTVTVVANPPPITIALETVPLGKGILEVHAVVEGKDVAATVEVLGTTEKFTTPFSLEVDVGTYTLRATYEEQIPQTQDVVVGEGQTVIVTFNFKPSPPPIPLWKIASAVTVVIGGGLTGFVIARGR